MLFVAACLVLSAIRLLQEPRTAGQIDAFFTPDSQKQSTGNDNADFRLLDTIAESRELPLAAIYATNAETAGSGTQDQFDLSAVRDNTYFRAEENAAWFAVWRYLQGSIATEIMEQSPAAATYAQLIDQPETYRGKAISVRGTAMRMELLDAPTNDVGIERYYRLIVRPEGGGVWPIVIYCLQLPENFRIDKQLHAEVKASGIFFKNWSYSWQGGLGLAPVVLAKTFQWRPPIVVARPVLSLSPRDVLFSIAATVALATLAGWLAWRHSRRLTTAAGSGGVLPPIELE